MSDAHWFRDIMFLFISTAPIESCKSTHIYIYIYIYILDVNHFRIITQFIVSRASVQNARETQSWVRAYNIAKHCIMYLIWRIFFFHTKMVPICDIKLVFWHYIQYTSNYIFVFINFPQPKWLIYDISHSSTGGWGNTMIESMFCWVDIDQEGRAHMALVI